MYRPGHWVVLHKRAFGPQATKLNKLESKEAYGPYRILEVDWDRGRIRVELGNDFTKGKINLFSMQDVRKHWVRKPWHTEALSLEERAKPQGHDDEEYEVDGISSRKFKYGKYRYAVSFKGYDEDTKHLPREDPDLEHCQKLIDDFNGKHPFGSLPYDKPADRNQYLQKTTGGTRRSNRLRMAVALASPTIWLR